MERAGAGGSIFRNFYRDFLIESYDILKSTEIKRSSSLFKDIARQWGEVAELLEETSSTLNQKYLVQASELCRKLATAEVEAMKTLGAV